jgi:hypothetical protein
MSPSVYPFGESAVKPTPETRDNHLELNQGLRPLRYLKSGKKCEFRKCNQVTPTNSRH